MKTYELNLLRCMSNYALNGDELILMKDLRFSRR
jgi:hypothetical protein